jgi:phage shock protein C
MKRLYRSQTDRKLGGVCGGIAEYANIDPTIVRLALVVIALFTALVPATIGYIIAWVIVPEPPIKNP